MPKASELTTEKVSFLFIGSPGLGKTLAAASFAVGGPVHISYFDKSSPIELVDFFRNRIKRPDLLDNIEYDVYSSRNCGEYLDYLKRAAKDRDWRYFVEITDSVTNLTSAAVNWSLTFGNPYRTTELKTVIPSWDEYKVETSLITQALDILREAPCHVIFTAHPIGRIKLDQSSSGGVGRVSHTNPIVSYGSKVGDIIPGTFTEIYTFSKTTEFTSEGYVLKYMVDTEGVGDNAAKSALGLKSMDITNKLFYEVWSERVNGGVK